MDALDAPPPKEGPTSPQAKMLDFLLLIGKLKHIKRTGWVLRQVPDPECVAAHMHRMAIITLLLGQGEGEKASPPLDAAKCMRLALIHDLAECIVGDITPHCGVDPVEKHRREDEAMKSLCDLVGDRGPEIYSLYKEYEAKETNEAKFVKELDYFDMILEAYSYERAEDRGNRLQEFFDSTKEKFSHPLMVGLTKELNHRRQEFAQADPTASSRSVE